MQKWFPVRFYLFIFFLNQFQMHMFLTLKRPHTQTNIVITEINSKCNSFFFCVCYSSYIYFFLFLFYLLAFNLFVKQLKMLKHTSFKLDIE